MANGKGRQSYIMVLLASCGLSGSAVGMIMNVPGLFFTPVSEALGISMAQVSLTLTIAVICSAVTAAFLPKLLSPRSFKPFLWGGTMAMAGGTVLMAMAQDCILLYLGSVIRGVGAGMMNFVLITILLNNWFEARKGVVTSSVMAVAGLTGVLLSPFLSTIVEQLGWRVGFYALSLLMVLFCLPALLFPITLTPQEKGLRPYGNELQPDQSKQKAGNWQTIPSLLMILAFVYAFMSNILTGFPQHLPSFAAVRGFGPEFGALLLSLAMVSNVAGKVLIGLLTDHFGFRRAAMPYLIFILMSLFCFWVLPGKVAVCAGALLFGMCYAMGTAGMVSLALDLFGTDRYESVSPKLFLVGNTTNALASSLYGLLYDTSGNYGSSLLLCGTMTVMILFMIPFAYRLRAKTT